VGPSTLAQVLRHLPPMNDPNLLVGLGTADDTAAYRLGKDLVLLATVDFFTPVVDDPYLFGQIAAANALSDIYAMGGRPLFALNIVCFPDCLPPEVMGEILRGGADKVVEAGAVIAGGHTVTDTEPKYGLAVTGLAPAGGIVTNAGARPGDLLVLTKPLGTGILVTALKGDLLDDDTLARAVESMRTLNREAGAAVTEFSLPACTDITGFGLLGHAAEMARASGVSLVLRYGALPLLPRVEELAAMGLIPAGTYKNRDHLAVRVKLAPRLSRARELILFDPQTSGGLLIAVPPDRVDGFLTHLRSRGVAAAGVVGRVTEPGPALITVEE